MIDTHNHLYVEQFEEDFEQVLANADEAGVLQHFWPSIDSAYTQRMYDLEAKYPHKFRLMMGLHPTHVNPDTLHDELDHVYHELSNRKFAAIGEIGIDLYWDKSTLDIQIQAFEQQILWAKEFRLPIVLHIRDSFSEVFQVLDNHRSEELTGIFHCFTGSLEDAQHAVDLGFKLGIGGVVTFKNGKIDQFLHQIPLENIVLETDSPYLAPKPHRGKRNEPAYLKLIAQKMAEVYGVNYQKIVETTTANAHSVFVDY